MFLNMTLISKVTRLDFSRVGLRTRWGLGLLALLPLLPACTKSYLTDGQVTITTGQEPEAWAASRWQKTWCSKWSCPRAEPR